MLTGGQWILLDNAAFVFQVVLVAVFAVRNARGHDSVLIAAGLAFLQLLLLSPNTRLVFGGLGEAGLWRLAPWDIRPAVLAGLSSYDAALIALSIFIFFRAAIAGRFRSVQFPLALFFATIAMGTASLAFRVYDLDVSRFLIAFRSALLFGTFLSLGLNISRPHYEGLVKSFFVQFMVLYLVGCVSMLLLAPGERWNRYGMATFLPSQTFWVISYIALIVAMFSRVSIGQRLFLLIVALFPLWGLSKTAATLYGCVLIVYFICKWFPAWLTRLPEFSGWAAAIIVAVSFAGIVVVVAYSLFLDNRGALGTRHYQFLNLWHTLVEDNRRLLCGIGWNQWYKITIDFVEIDYGAWDALEFGNTDFRAALQTSLLPVLRGAGLIGVVLFTTSLIAFTRQAMPQSGPPTVRATRVLLLLLAVTTWSSFPELGFDAVAFSAFILGYLLRCRQVPYPLVPPPGTMPGRHGGRRLPHSLIGTERPRFAGHQGR